MTGSKLYLGDVEDAKYSIECSHWHAGRCYTSRYRPLVRATLKERLVAFDAWKE
jgi:hypothetical protein